MKARAALAMAVLSMASTNAAAQEHNRLAVGVNFSHRGSTDPLAHGDFGFGIKWRLGHGDEGWGWHYGLSWYATNIDWLAGGTRAPLALGELKIRPILAGYGYTRAIGPRLLMTTDVVGGLAYASLNVEDNARDALRQLPTGAASVDVGAIAPVIKPEFSIWYDVHPKFGISIDAGYIIARPRVTVSSALLRESRHFRADTFSFSAGFVYRILQR